MEGGRTGPVAGRLQVVQFADDEDRIHGKLNQTNGRLSMAPVVLAVVLKGHGPGSGLP